MDDPFQISSDLLRDILMSSIKVRRGGVFELKTTFDPIQVQTPYHKLNHKID